MPRLTAADFDPEVLELFDQYVHGGISRRGFLDAAGKYAVGGATAAGLLAALAPDFASARQVDPGDPRLATSTLAFDSPQGYGKASGYLARPAKAAGDIPAILVIHENRGLNPHIEDIARRLALEGYVALRPTRCSRSAAIRATRTRRASCSASSTRPRCRPTSSPRRNCSRRRPAPTAAWAR